MNQNAITQDSFKLDKTFDYETLLGLLDHLQEGVVIHADDTAVIYANASALEILGLSSEEILGKRAMHEEWYFLDESLERIAPDKLPINRLYKYGENLVHEVIAIHLPDKPLKWIDISATIVTDKKGLRNAMVVFSDVSERKRAYDEASLFKRVVACVDTGITIADVSLPDMPLIYANDAYIAMTGYSAEEAIGKNCRYLQAQDREQTGRYTIKKAYEAESSCSVELKNYTKSGELFYNLLTLSPLKEREKVRYYVGVQHNITPLK